MQATRSLDATLDLSIPIIPAGTMKKKYAVLLNCVHFRPPHCRFSLDKFAASVASKIRLLGDAGAKPIVGWDDPFDTRHAAQTFDPYVHPSLSNIPSRHASASSLVPPETTDVPAFVELASPTAATAPGLTTIHSVADVAALEQQIVQATQPDAPTEATDASSTQPEATSATVKSSVPAADSTHFFPVVSAPMDVARIKKGIVGQQYYPSFAHVVAVFALIRSARPSAPCSRVWRRSARPS